MSRPVTHESVRRILAASIIPLSVSMTRGDQMARRCCPARSQTDAALARGSDSARVEPRARALPRAARIDEVVRNRRGSRLSRGIHSTDHGGHRRPEPLDDFSFLDDEKFRFVPTISTQRALIVRLEYLQFTQSR